MGAATIRTETLSRLSDPEVRRFLAEKWALIEEQFAPSHFILFGSRVRGTAHEWSDLDAIIVSSRFAGIRFIKRAYRFKTAIRPHVGMTALCYTPEEFEELRGGIGVVADACREGVWLKDAGAAALASSSGSPGDSPGAPLDLRTERGHPRRSQAPPSSSASSSSSSPSSAGPPSGPSSPGPSSGAR
ncbi:MAG: nucleotidyltransferase domain-containing protein [Planctomycetes bacterium]|nr:nucleotidyltransferase domain-containing protein [Planctomycetota bacterium]